MFRATKLTIKLNSLITADTLILHGMCNATVIRWIDKTCLKPPEFAESLFVYKEPIIQVRIQIQFIKSQNVVDTATNCS